MKTNKLTMAIAMMIAIPIAGQTTTKTTIHYDTLQWADSMVVIQTICAPICSSVARVYDIQGVPMHNLPAPNDHWVFPEAYIENDSIRWRDNTYLMLDEEEKK